VIDVSAATVLALHLFRRDALACLLSKLGGKKKRKENCFVSNVQVSRLAQ
jgi:hypothetical protein